MWTTIGCGALAWIVLSVGVAWAWRRFARRANTTPPPPRWRQDG